MTEVLHNTPRPIRIRLNDNQGNIKINLINASLAERDIQRLARNAGQADHSLATNRHTRIYSIYEHHSHIIIERRK